MTVFLRFLYLCNINQNSKKNEKISLFFCLNGHDYGKFDDFLLMCHQNAPHPSTAMSDDLQKNAAYYNAQDWKDAALKFQDIRHDIGKYRYTPDERRQIGELEGQCARYMVEGVKNGALNTVMGVANEIRGILDGLGIRY